MKTKLTLNVNGEIIEKMKAYARENGRSLSDLIENYFLAITQRENSNSELSPKVKRLLGVVKIQSSFNYKQELKAALSRRYLK